MILHVLYAALTPDVPALLIKVVETEQYEEEYDERYKALSGATGAEIHPRIPVGEQTMDDTGASAYTSKIGYYDSTCYNAGEDVHFQQSLLGTSAPRIKTNLVDFPSQVHRDGWKKGSVIKGALENQSFQRSSAVIGVVLPQAVADSKPEVYPPRLSPTLIVQKKRAKAIASRSTRNRHG